MIQTAVTCAIAIGILRNAWKGQAWNAWKGHVTDALMEMNELKEIIMYFGVNDVEVTVNVMKAINDAMDDLAMVVL